MRILHLNRKNVSIALIIFLAICLVYLAVNHRWFVGTRSSSLIESDWNLIKKTSVLPGQCKGDGSYLNTFFKIASDVRYFNSYKEDRSSIKYKLREDWNEIYARHKDDLFESSWQFFAVFSAEMKKKWANDGREALKKWRLGDTPMRYDGSTTALPIDKKNLVDLIPYGDIARNDSNPQTLLELEKLSQLMHSCGSLLDFAVAQKLYTHLRSHNVKLRALKEPSHSAMLAVIARELLTNRKKMRESLPEHEYFLRIRQASTGGNAHIVSKMPIIMRSLSRDARVWEDVMGQYFRSLHENRNDPRFKTVLSQGPNTQDLSSYFIKLLFIHFSFYMYPQ